MWILIFLVLTTDEAPLVLEAGSLVETASRVFAEGVGRSERLTADRLDEAGNQLGGPFRELSISARSESELGDTITPGDDELAAALVPWRPGVRGAERRALTAEARAARARFRAEELAFIRAVLTQFAEAETTNNDLTHLKGFIASGRAIADDLARAAEEGLISRDDVLAWQAHLAVLLREEAALNRLASTQHTGLAALLGGEVAPRFEAHVHLDEELHIPENPWPAVAALIDRDPVLAAWQASAMAADHQAEATFRETGIQWSPELGYRESGDERWVGVGVRAAFSLAPRKNTTWRRHRLDAARAEVEERWARRRREAAWSARGTAFDRLRAQLDTYRTEILEPLTERVTLLEQALAEGQVDVRRLVDAREQLHEGEHQFLGMVLMLEQEHREARALRQLLEKTP